MRELHPMQAIKPAEERMRVLLHMRVVPLQDAEQKLVLRMSNGFDDESVVARKVEKRARFARRAQLGEDVFRGEREEVVGGVELETVFAKIAENPGCVVFEFEIVFRRWRQFISDTR